MARFKEGQQIICVSPDHQEWRDRFGNTCAGPVHNEIVTVAGYINDIELLLFEYPDESDEGFNEVWFEPLMDIAELTEILKSQPAEV